MVNHCFLCVCLSLRPVWPQTTKQDEFFLLVYLTETCLSELVKILTSSYLLLFLCPAEDCELRFQFYLQIRNKIDLFFLEKNSIDAPVCSCPEDTFCSLTMKQW